MEESLNTRYFFSSFSFREILSSFSLALIVLAFFVVTNYYAEEDSIEKYGAAIKYAALLCSIPMNHAFFRWEHKRSNNFLGRVMHDLIFFVIVGLTFILYSWVSGNGGRLSWSDSGYVILFVIFGFFFSLVFELGIALVKKFLGLFGWRPL